MIQIKKEIKEKLRSLIPHIFLRTRPVDYDFYAGTTSWRDCASVLSSLLKSEPLQDGPYIRAYERLAARYHGVRYAYSFATGRMALYAIMEALGIGRGDEVIIPAYTCVVVPNAILYRGARPVYVDIDPRTFNIDARKIEAAITKRTKAILAQHTFGLPCDLDEINRIAKKHGITVIEDCAQALGAEYKGRKAGSIGRVGFFSSDHTKMISTSSGGMITTDDRKLASKIEKIYSETQFLTKSAIRRTLFAFIGENFLHHPKFNFIGKWLSMLCSYSGLFHFFRDEKKTRRPLEYPYPSRLSNLQAKVGIRQLNELEQNIAHRRQIAREYDRVFGLYPEQFNGSSDRKHVFLRYSFLIKDRDSWDRRFSRYLQLGDWFNSIAIGRKRELYKIGYRTGSCPAGEAAARHSANLPTHNKVKNPGLLVRFAREMVSSGALVRPDELESFGKKHK